MTRITIEIDEGKEKRTIVTDIPEGQNMQQDQKEDPAAGELPEYTAEEMERINAASDLANVCEWLEDSEVIQLKLIVQKCQRRKERAEA